MWRGALPATMPHDVRRPHRGRQTFEIGAQNGERDIALLPLWKCNREPTSAVAASVICVTSPIRRQSADQAGSASRLEQFPRLPNPVCFAV
jgi:hypothetical protein